MKTNRCVIPGLLALSVFGLAVPVFAAEIPADLDSRGDVVDAGSALQTAGLSSEAAQERAGTLDAVETAELSRVDRVQAGGCGNSRLGYAISGLLLVGICVLLFG